MHLTDDQLNYMMKLPKYGEGIFRHPSFDRPFLVKIPGDLDLDKTVSPEQISETMRPWINEIQEKYCIEAEEKEPLDINNLFLDMNIQTMGLQILKYLGEKPFNYYTNFREILGISARKLSAAVDWLESEELITRISCLITKNKRADFLALTTRGQKSLDIPGAKRIHPRRFRHSYYCEMIRISLLTQGYEPVIREYSLTGEDQPNPKPRVDVFTTQDGEAVAYEVQLTQNKKNVMDNVHKCLSYFGVDLLYLIGETGHDLEKLKKFVQEEGLAPEDNLGKIKFKTIGDFLKKN